MEKKLIVIDLSNFIFRAFFAIRVLHAPSGVPVNAVYGVLSMLFNMIQKHKPTHILVARDTKEGSFRKEIYPDYKAHRTEPPDDLKPQFDLVDQLIQRLNLSQIKIAGYEADDIIGSVVTQWKNDFDEILIASGDKDLMQFVDQHIKMLDTMKDKTYERNDVKEKMGVFPEQIVDYLSLIGDSSDNIPGVEGIGPKGAQGLLEEFKNLDTILQNVDHIKNKRVQSSLMSQKEMAIISKKLAQIVMDLPLGMTQAQSQFKLQLSPELEEFLEQLGFKTWISKLNAFKPIVEVPLKIKEISPPEKYQSNLSLDQFEQMLKGQSLVAIYPLRENSLDQFGIWRGMAVATINESGFFETSPESLPSFLKILNQFSGIVICYEVKPLLQLAKVSGLDPVFRYFDTASAHFVIQPEHKHDLATIVQEYLDERIEEEDYRPSDLFASVTEADKSQLVQRSRVLMKLYSALKTKMEELELVRPFEELDLPLIKILAEMELEGVRLDQKFYQELEIEFSEQSRLIELEVQKTSGDKINLKSPKQVGELLFDKLQLPVIRKTKTGYSTDADVLSELIALNLSPIPEMILKYRELEKLLSTYVKSLPLLVDQRTHKLHTHYQLANAATGRLSSDHPNLQNIPIRTENGRKLRRGFLPSPGRVLLSADYSQVELRLLAHFSQDPQMLQAFKEDRDIHSQTAAEIFDLSLDKVTKSQRNAAKAINFGLMYGQTSFGLSQALHISQTEAKNYITHYFHKFQAVKTFLDGLKESAEKSGYVQTLFGRKRFLPDIRSSNRQIKAMAERVAINSPIQGTAADIIKLAMIHIHNIMKSKNLKSKMILQVHDELIFDVDPEEMEEMKQIVKEGMENAVSLTVTLKVEMGIGANWFDLK